MLYTEFLLTLSSDVRKKIEKQIQKLYDGKFGNCQRIRTCCMKLQKGISLNEYKINIGCGYRIYYSIINNNIKILAAGTKKTQRKDIECCVSILEKLKQIILFCFEKTLIKII